MSTQRNTEHRRDKSTSRDRDVINKAKQKRREERRFQRRANSLERNPGPRFGPPFPGAGCGNWNNNIPPWSFNPNIFPGPRFGGFGNRPMFMNNDFQIRGPFYHDFTDDYYGNGLGPNNNDYRCAMPPPPPPSGPRFGDGVLEKAENMVNELAEKRKQVTEERGRSRKTFESASPHKDPSQPSLSIGASKSLKSKSAGNSPRLGIESWTKASLGLKPPVDRDNPATATREVSPPRTRPVAKVDASKVASKADALSRASIAKLINAPRSHKEKQRLASLVKKTKPKTVRPKLNVNAVPEVTSIEAFDSPVEVSEMLDLVELPENLRLQVENLLENGPDTTTIDLRSPTKSPVAKKAKTESSFAREIVVNDDVTSVASTENLSLKLNDLRTSGMTADPTWETDSVVSDVTSIGQSDDDRRPFERLADKVTSDPKLNDLLDSRRNSAERAKSPCEADLLDSSRIEALVHQALGTKPKRSEFKRPEDPTSRKSKSPSGKLDSRVEHASSNQHSSKHSQSALVAGTLATQNASSQAHAQNGPQGVNVAKRGGAVSETTTSPSRSGNASVRPETGLTGVRTGQENRNSDIVRDMTDSGYKSGIHVSNEECKDNKRDSSEGRQSQAGDFEAYSDSIKPLTAADLLQGADGLSPLQIASRAFSLGKTKVRDTGDSLMSLHVAIHAPQKTDDTVNMVLEITEREEQLGTELETIDAHTEVLKRLIDESKTEVDRLMKLREKVRGDGEVLRKQRLELLRAAVSKKDDVTSTQMQPTVSSSSAPGQEHDEDQGHSATDSNQTTPRNSGRVDEDDMTMEYVGSISMDLLHSGDLWQSLHGGQDSDFSDHVLDQGEEASFLDHAHEDLGSVENVSALGMDEVDQVSSGAGSKKRKKAKRLVVGTAVEKKSKKKSKAEVSVAKEAKKTKKDKKNVFLEMCREIGSPVDSRLSSKKSTKKARSGKNARRNSIESESYSELETPKIQVRFDTGTDDVTNDESELDSREKVKARFLKAVDDSEAKVKESKQLKERKKQCFKTQLLKSVDVELPVDSHIDGIPDPIVQSTMLDHEIAIKLQKCSVTLQKLQESKLKKDVANLTKLENKKKKKDEFSVEKLTKSKKETKTKKKKDDSVKEYCRPLPEEAVTSFIEPSVPVRHRKDSVSIVSDNMTEPSTSSKTDSTGKRRKTKRQRNERQNPAKVVSSSGSEYDSEDFRWAVMGGKTKPQVFPSDSRKDKLREMGIILSASELEEFCKDGHNISDQDSVILTARTEDLMIQTPRSDLLDTARTEDLLKPIQGVADSRTSMSSATPEESDSYSSCVESIDPNEIRLRSTTDSFALDIKPLGSTADSMNYSLLESTQSDTGDVGAIPNLYAIKVPLDSDEESKIDEKYEKEKSKEVQFAGESDTSDRSDNMSERYRETIARILNESEDDGSGEWHKPAVKSEVNETVLDDDVLLLEQSGTLPPLSARSDRSLPAYGHNKQKFSGHKAAVTSMVLHGDYMYTCSPQESMVKKFDLATGECVHQFTGNTENIYTMATLDLDGKSYLYTGGYDCKLVQYDLETDECLDTDRMSAKIRCLISRWEKLYIGLCSGDIFSLNPQTKAFRSLISSGRSVSCMDTGVEGSRQVLVVGSFDPLISIHDANNGLLLRTISSHARVPLSVKVHVNNIYSAGADKYLKQHDLYSGEEVRSVQLHHPVTDIVLHNGQIYVACFDGLIRCFSKELELKGLYYGAGCNYLLRLAVHNDKLYSTNKNGYVEGMPIVEELFMCQCKECRLGFGLISDLEYHVTEKHIHSRLDDNVPVYYCSWIGCCFETGKRMDLENHLLNHIEILANDDSNY